MMMMMATTFGNKLSQPLVAKKKKTRRSSKIRKGGGVGVGDHHQLSNRQGAPAAAATGNSDGARTPSNGAEAEGRTKELVPFYVVVVELILGFCNSSCSREGQMERWKERGARERSLAERGELAILIRDGTMGRK